MLMKYLHFNKTSVQDIRNSAKNNLIYPFK